MGEENIFYPSNHASSPGSKKLRLMCSNGGHIVPRPHDKSLCYIGGETRMVVVDRHITLRELTHRLSKTLLRSSSSSTASFILKYQLPLEDLDSLISVTNDEDLENMIEEYERLNSSSSSSASSRLRLFMFATNPESVSSIGSFLENSSKSEDWFLNALNGTASGFSDTSSVNCLLSLDDEIEISLPEKKDVNHKGAIVTNFAGNNSGQDVHSIPDSPMMETTSSFGSASSTPSLNLPPIRVNVIDHQKVVGGGIGIEEQFSQTSVQQRHQDDAGLVALVSPVPLMVSGSPMTVVPELPDPFLSSQQKQSTLSDLTLTDQSSPVIQIQSPSSNNPAADPIDTLDQNIRIQTQQQKIPNSAYLHHQQLQFISPQQYIHHHHPSGAVPVASYCHHPPMDQQNFMYYMPSRQPPQGYNFPFQANAPPVTATQVPQKTDFPADVYRATNPGAPQLVRVPSIPQNHPQYIYATQSMPPFQYHKMASSSPIEACLQEQQLRAAQP